MLITLRLKSVIDLAFLSGMASPCYPLIDWPRQSLQLATARGTI
jgi:hypothetical protein